ncbi:MAG: sn-glycerol-3-phosphate ABC transporter ATP-binding protein UgpC [Eubacteriales bacterium]|nr:sn-glycerol-3-phosphate ABC transporter ATP-binding protein UgpC [Eubacteriales bacterium]
MSNIIFKNITKKYPAMTRKDKGVIAVNNFNLEIQDEEFIIFVGPSGCGKTTTLRMIAGLEEITEGEISINGKVVNKVHPKDRNIAMVFQNYALYPQMTVFQNLAFSLKLRHMPKDQIRAKVKETAEILNITPLLDRKPKALSGGQRQRVALGRAIVRDPAVFLMDEPLSNLDAKLRVQMRTEITKLYKNLKATIIYVTHDQVEAMTMGTRIVVMNNGVIQQIAAPTVLYKKPENMFVAGFIGSPSMNFINGKVVKSGSELIIEFGGSKLLLTPEKAKALEVSGYIDKDIIFGIRPEHIHYSNGSKQDEKTGQLDITADVVEPLGAEEIIYFQFDEHQCAAKTVDVNVNAGDKVRMTIDIEKVHIFDSETKNTITN